MVSLDIRITEHNFCLLNWSVKTQVFQFNPLAPSHHTAVTSLAPVYLQARQLLLRKDHVFLGVSI